MKRYNFLAFDIGATSGRAVLGTLEGDTFEMQEIHRYPNAIMELHGKYYWNIYRLYEALKEEHLELIKAIKFVKDKARKEFAERLKKGTYRIAIESASSKYRYIREEHIDILLKELEGEQ